MKKIVFLLFGFMLGFLNLQYSSAKEGGTLKGAAVGGVAGAAVGAVAGHHKQKKAEKKDAQAQNQQQQNTSSG